MGKIKTRKFFRFLPAIVWAIGLDLIDLGTNIVSGILSIFPLTLPIGLGLDVISDTIQLLLAALIFEDPIIFFGAVEYVLPPGFDIFPTFTMIVILKGG